MSLLSIDIGSSACKAVTFSTDGMILAEHSRSYRPAVPRPGYAEIAPELLWGIVVACCHEAAAQTKEPVSALCLSSHGESFVPLTSSGSHLGPIILNQDGRAFLEAEWIAREFGGRKLFQVTGLVSHPMYPAAKLLWLRKHVPEVFGRDVRFVTIVGYLLARLGLEPLVDYSLASRYMTFDVRRKDWSSEILNLVGLTKDSFPTAVPAGTLAGALDARSASALGLQAGTKVVLGGHDQPCSAVGLGAITAGRVTDSMGTYECLLATSDEPDHSNEAYAASLNSYCHVLPGKFATIAYFPSGIMVDWFRNLLAGDAQTGPSYAELEAGTKPHPSGLLITPNLIGTCNPDFNMHARSVIAGLHVSTSRADIYQGILEGLACEFTRMTHSLGNAAREFDDVYAMGGGTESQLGLRLRAAISGKKLHVTTSRDAVCVGGAVLAGVAVGEYKDAEEGVRNLVHEAAMVEPDPALSKAYEGYLTQYLRLYEASASLQGAKSFQVFQERR